MARKKYNGKKNNGMSSMDNRRRKEQMDSQMIKEDPSCIANLPKEVVMKEYGVPYYSGNMDLNDSISGVDAQIDEDVSAMAKYGQRGKKYPQKY